MSIEPSKTGRRHKQTQTLSNGKGGVRGRGHEKWAGTVQVLLANIQPAEQPEPTAARSHPMKRGRSSGLRSRMAAFLCLSFVFLFPHWDQRIHHGGKHTKNTSEHQSSSQKNQDGMTEEEELGASGRREERERKKGGEDRRLKCQKCPRGFLSGTRRCALIQLRVFHTAAC